MTRLEAAQRLFNEMVKTKPDLEAGAVTSVSSGGPLEVAFRFAHRSPLRMRGNLARAIHRVLRSA
jgi:hypothetical protein